MPACCSVLLEAATAPEVEPPMTPTMVWLATYFCATRLRGRGALLDRRVTLHELDLQAHRLGQRLDRVLGPGELLLAEERRRHP